MRSQCSRQDSQNVPRSVPFPLTSNTYALNWPSHLRNSLPCSTLSNSAGPRSNFSKLFHLMFLFIEHTGVWLVCERRFKLLYKNFYQRFIHNLMKAHSRYNACRESPCPWNLQPTVSSQACGLTTDSAYTNNWNSKATHHKTIKQNGAIEWVYLKCNFQDESYRSSIAIIPFHNPE